MNYLFSGKNKKDCINLSSAKTVLKVKDFGSA